MSGDITLPGSGSVVATDRIAGADYQRIKLIKGPDGTNNGDIHDANPLPTHDEDAVLLLQRLLMALSSPQGYDRSLQRNRVSAVLESGTVTTVSTVTTVTTVTTCATVSSVSNIAAIDGLQPRIQIYGANLSAWKDCVRSCIT